MVTDLGPLSKVQLCSQVLTDPGLALGNLLQNYILACQVEGKSPATIEAYHRRLRDFLRYKACVSKRLLSVY